MLGQRVDSKFKTKPLAKRSGDWVTNIVRIDFITKRLLSSCIRVVLLFYGTSL